MKECKCTNVKFYDDDGWRCIRCYRTFCPTEWLEKLPRFESYYGPPYEDDAGEWVKYHQMVDAMFLKQIEKHGTG